MMYTERGRLVAQNQQQIIRRREDRNGQAMKPTAYEEDCGWRNEREEGRGWGGGYLYVWGGESDLELRQCRARAINANQAFQPVQGQVGK